MGDLRTGPFLVHVPASSANLGPGFDSLGLALELHDSLTAMISEDSDVLIEVEGEGALDLALDSSHLVARSMALGFASLGVQPAGFVLRCSNRIPHGRGLGSSAAAIIGGLVLARAMVVGGSDLLSDHSLLQLALELEPHPDNLAAALLGGFTTAWISEGVAFAARQSVLPGIAPVIAIPELQVSTAHARQALPASVARADATFNIARSALLIHALTNEPSQLLAATEDRLHQESRRSMYPASMELVDRLRQGGMAAVISGAGPCVLVLGPVGMVDAVRAMAGPGWRIEQQQVSERGAHVDGPSAA